jgi:uncharacterized protein YggE
VRASGDGVVYARPDRAIFDIGVVTEAATAQAAGSQNAAQVQSMLAKLRGVIGPQARVQSTSYALNPEYQYPKSGGKPTISGYRAVNVVEVTMDDLAAAGKAIDAATEGGANEIQRLRFTLKDEKPARAEALRQAAEAARANAEAMAAALGLKLGRVLRVEQGAEEGVIRPQPMAMARAAGAVATPVEAEAIEVRATVTLTVALQ